jgi:hypothetical protein
MKRVFLGIATVICITQGALAGPFYDPIGGGATTFGAGITYTSGFGRHVFTSEVYADADKCLKITFAALSNDVFAILSCHGWQAYGHSYDGPIVLQVLTQDKGFCGLMITIESSTDEPNPGVDDFDVIVQQENNGHAICFP